MSVADLCNQFYDTVIRTFDEQMPDSQAQPLFRSLAAAGRSVDLVTATDIDAIAAAGTPADTSASAQVAFRRCAALGFPPTSDQLARIRSLSTTPVTVP